jgi:hypothetical protein
MSSSNNTIFQLSKLELVEAILRKLSVLGEGQSANTIQILTGTEALNTVVYMLQAKGMSLWSRKEIDLVLIANQQNYSIGIGTTNNVPFPLQIEQATLKYNIGNSFISLTPYANYDFLNLPVSNGVPVGYQYTPGINTGILKLWPIPDASSSTQNTIELSYFQPFDKFVSNSDTASFTQEWHLPLIYQTAVVLADEYSKSIQEKQWLSKLAEQYTEIAMDAGNEMESVYFQPMRH